MTITMSYQEYNRMQDFAKQFAAKAGGINPILEYIKLTFDGDTAKAEALDGYKAGYITLSINDCKTEGEMLLPVTSKLKKVRCIRQHYRYGKRDRNKDSNRSSYI